MTKSPRFGYRPSSAASAAGSSAIWASSRSWSSRSSAHSRFRRRYSVSKSAIPQAGGGSWPNVCMLKYSKVGKNSRPSCHTKSALLSAR